MFIRSPMLLVVACAAALPHVASAKDLCGKLAGAEVWNGSFSLRVSREDGDSREYRKYNWNVSGNVSLLPHVEDGTRRPAEWHASRQQYQATVDDVERDSQQNTLKIHLGDLESNSNQAHLRLNCRKGTYSLSIVAGIWREQRKLTLSDQLKAQCARANPLLDMLCATVRKRATDAETERHTFQLSAMSDDHAFPQSGALSGSDEVELGQHLQSGERLKATLSWNLSPGGHKPVEVTVEPPDGYERWIPRGDLDAPGKAASQLTFRLKVHEKGDPSSRRSAKLKVMLIDVSNEKGVCMNWPVNGEPGKGLRLPRRENKGLTFANDADVGETPEAVEELEVVVTSHDFGAFGRLHIEGVGQTVETRFKDKGGDVTIPRDDNENQIADEWEERYGGAGPAAGDDDDVPEGDKHTGDVLSRYEEYRGFRISGALDTGAGELVTGQHVRTSPRAKDVFIIDTLRKGVGPFGLSGLRVHLLELEEVGASAGGAKNPLSVNPNRGNATRGEQYPIVIEAGGSPEDLGGAATVGLPRDCPYVQVDPSKSDLLETIAHELAHCTNVPHHGNEATLIRKAKVIKDYVEDGAITHKAGEVTPFPEDTFQLYFDGNPSSPAIGDSNCFMHYVPAFVLSTDSSPNTLELTDQFKKKHLGKPSNRGHARYAKTRFCGASGWTTTTQQAAPKDGGGNCLSHFCVNHLKH